MIIGLTGKYAAGKGAVARRLCEGGFAYHSLSDAIREELAARGIPESREALLAMGNTLRRDEGPGVLAERMVPRLTDGADHVIDSIRNPAEVARLRPLDGFMLIAVRAASRLRFERLRARGRIGDPTTWQAFTELEGRELHSNDPTRQQLDATLALADRVIENDGSSDALRAEVMRLLSLLRADSCRIAPG